MSPGLRCKSHTNRFSSAVGEDSYRDTPYSRGHLGPQRPAAALFLRQREEDLVGDRRSQPRLQFLNKTYQKAKVSLNEIKQLSLLLCSSSRDSVEFLGCHIFTVYETVIPNSNVSGSF